MKISTLFNSADNESLCIYHHIYGISILGLQQTTFEWEPDDTQARVKNKYTNTTS